LAFAALLGFLLCASASGQSTGEGPGVSLVTGISATHDDNLYKLPPDISPTELGASNPSRGDTFFMPFFNLDGRTYVGEQRFDLAAGANREVFRSHTDLDQTYYNEKAEWGWQSGKELSGDILESVQTSQTSFAYFQGSQLNVQTLRNLHASAEWRPRPDRHLAYSFDEGVGDNSSGPLQYNNFRTAIDRVEVGADSGLGHEITLGVTDTHTDYPNRVIVYYAPIDNSYMQRQVDLSTRYAYSTLTALTVSAGYARRYYANVPDRDFSGPVGKVALTWQPTDRTTLSLSGGRDLNSFDDAFRIYTVTTSAQVSAAYQAASKILVTLGADAYRMNYKGEPQNLLTFLYGPAPPRYDTMWDYRIDLSWSLSDRWMFKFDSTLARRTSTEADFSFRDVLNVVTLQYRIGN
jgi:hypothetical protein